MLKTALSTIMEYLLHASTWKGLFNLLASGGILTVSDTKQAAITAAALGVVGVIQVFIDDSDKTKTLTTTTTTTTDAGATTNGSSTTSAS